MAMATDQAFASRFVNGQGRQHEPEGAPRLFEYWRLCKRRWKTIAFSTLLAGIAAGLWAEFLAKPQYLATAILKPSQEEGAALGITTSSPLDALSLGAGLGQGDATEYQKILDSYDFTLAVARHFHLDEAMRQHRSWIGKLRHPVLTDFMIYKSISPSFRSDYDSYSGTVSISFQDSDPQRAQELLAYYIDSLRRLLKKRNTERSSVAAKAITEEARRTPDVVLQNTLEMMAAQQLQNAALASAQADYAFKVLHAPVADDKPYSPVPLLDVFVAALAAFMVSAFWITIVRPMRDWYDEYEGAMASNGYLPVSNLQSTQKSLNELNGDDQRAGGSA